MDIYCPVCGEPWDHDELHYVAEAQDSDYPTVAANFRERGCEAMEALHSLTRNAMRAECAEAAYQLLGEDMDGAASMLDDL